jgi:photosystem II stability/assembly factor-like uncharacterized protein
MKRLLLLLMLAFATNVMQAQWAPQPSNITFGYMTQFIDAVDTNVCWALVSDPLSQTNPVEEFTRTVDGGNSWVGGFISAAAGLCPSSICAINADTAWVAMFDPTGIQGGIFQTTDGGANWTWQTTALFNATGNFPNIVYFWDGSNGICMGDPVGGNFEIYTTTDGGTNWVAVPSANIPTPLGGEFGITNVKTARDNHIWFGTNFGRIYHSADHGNTWTVGQTPFGDFIGFIAFRDTMNGICGSGGATGSADIARTTDGGNTWTLVGTNTAGMTLKQSGCWVPGTPATYFISTSFAGSVDGTTYSVNNGGNWVPVDNLIHTEVEFVNDSIGWTGSNEADGTMFKWSTPINVPSDDVSSRHIDVSSATGLITQSPKATFMNNGTTTQSFNVTMTITGGYSSTKPVTNLAFYDSTQVTFDPWTPAATGSFTISVYTSLGADSNHPNDTLTKNVTVYEAFTDCGWVSKTALPAARFGVAEAFDLQGLSSSSPGKVHVFGGSNGTAVTNLNTAYSTVSSTWTAMANMPNNKYQFCAHKVNGKIYCSGGYSTGFTTSPFTYIYNTASNTWSTGVLMPSAVGDYASGVYKDSLIYYIGGYGGTGDVNTVKIYNTYNNTWTTGTAFPGTACAGLRGAINGNTIVIAGGYSQTLATTLADAYKGIINPANPTQITWSALPAYPSGTISRLAAGTVFNDLMPMILFLGGDPTGQGTQALSDCWAYDINQSKWLIGSTKITPASNISNFAGVINNDTLWMASAGGYTGTAFSTAHEWLCLGPMIWTGVDQPYVIKNNAMTVYPNPVNDGLTVIMNESNHRTLSITDIFGRLVYSQAVNHLTMKINTANYDSGIYFITVSGDNGFRRTVKFVKE